MPSIQKNIVTSILNFADSCLDVYMLFVKNRQGLRKLSTDAKSKTIKNLNFQCGEMEKNSGDFPSVNGDCILLKVTKDAGANSGIFNTMEADKFSGLIDSFGSIGRLNFYENSCDTAVSSQNFAHMRCSCGELCCLVDGFTSCCGKSLNDVLFDIFDEMYVNKKKSYAMKFDDISCPLFYVGNAGSQLDLTTALRSQ